MGANCRVLTARLFQVNVRQNTLAYILGVGFVNFLNYFLNASSTPWTTIAKLAHNFSATPIVSLSIMFDNPIIYIFVGHVYVVFLWNKFTDIQIKCQIWVKNMQEYKIKLGKSNELGKTTIL